MPAKVLAICGKMLRDFVRYRRKSEDGCTVAHFLGREHSRKAINLPGSNPYPKALRKNPGHYLREWRLYLGLTQELLAERIGVDSSHISKNERSYRGNRPEILDKFAKGLGVEPSDLLKPPTPDRMELAAYVLRLDEQQRNYALGLLKAVFRDEDAEEKACIVLYPKSTSPRKSRR